MHEPVKCWMWEGRVYRHRLSSREGTPAVAVPIDLLERLVDDAVWAERHAGSTREQRDDLRTLIRELREEA